MAAAFIFKSTCPGPGLGSGRSVTMAWPSPNSRIARIFPVLPISPNAVSFVGADAVLCSFGV